ncbi:PepSY domain-containing protein [Solirhodobacter olei]|jgi:hypothetical protein|uniref:PepSY domain-containing protein n=1 Tax=Solirhodobacter olei TaxID=2493082 RepID=UPI000FDA6ED1|nr:PepSY domain-containing protein [Solirhodobacter olei]
MLRTLIVTVSMATLAGPALAGGMCSHAPASKFQPKTTLTKKLHAQGLKVRRIKTEGGCYEVYALDGHGKRVNVAFNAETLEKVDNAEAGEG